MVKAICIDIIEIPVDILDRYAHFNLLQALIPAREIMVGGKQIQSRKHPAAGNGCQTFLQGSTVNAQVFLPVFGKHFHLSPGHIVSHSVMESGL